MFRPKCGNQLRSFLPLLFLLVVAGCRTDVSERRETDEEISSSPGPTLGTPTPQPVKRFGIRIGLVNNADELYAQGCGCWFWDSNAKPDFGNPDTQKYLLIGNYEKQAWMNIDDEVVEFRRIRDTTKFQGKIGNRYFQSYRSNNGISVEVVCTATGYGDIHAVSCDSDITVKKNGDKLSVKAKGSCGC